MTLALLFLGLLALVLIGMISYFVFGTVFRAFSLSDLRAATRR